MHARHLDRIMQNTWINQYRKKQSWFAEISVENVTDQHVAADVLVASNRLRSAEVDALESLPDDEIKAALMTLREESRIAVYYADVEGFSYKEIASITNTSIGTVMSRLHRGRQRLRVALRMVASQRGFASSQPSDNARHFAKTRSLCSGAAVVHSQGHSGYARRYSRLLRGNSPGPQRNCPMDTNSKSTRRVRRWKHPGRSSQYCRCRQRVAALGADCVEVQVRIVRPVGSTELLPVVLYRHGGDLSIESTDGGNRIAAAIGGARAVILRNHGLLTVSATVDAAVGYFLLMERCAEVQVKEPYGRPIGAESARCVHDEFDEVAARQVFKCAQRSYVPDISVTGQ